MFTCPSTSSPSSWRALTRAFTAWLTWPSTSSPSSSSWRRLTPVFTAWLTWPSTSSSDSRASSSACTSFSSTVVLLSGLQNLLSRRWTPLESSRSCRENATARFCGCESPARAAARVGPCDACGLPQPWAATAPARLGRIDHRYLGVRGSALRLRVPARRCVGRRPGRADPVAAGGVRIAVHGRPRRPLSTRARDAGVGSAPSRGLCWHGRLRRDRRAAGGGVRARRLDVGHLDGIPAGAGRPPALAGPDAGGGDRRERHLEHAREPRLLRGPRPGRRAALRLDRDGRLRSHRGHLRLVGADAGAAPADERAASEA